MEYAVIAISFGLATAIIGRAKGSSFFIRVDLRARAAPALGAAARPPALFDVVGDRLVVAFGQLRRASLRADQIECLQDLRHFLRSLHRFLLAGLPNAASPSEGVGRCRSNRPVVVSRWGDPMAAHGE
ncbi:MAG: hypothetical protein ACRDMA_08795, partial [Solirubrobacterales bacterium]